VQTFTNELFLELETLGPLVTLIPGAQLEHQEHWFLFADVDLGRDQDQAAEALAPLLQDIERVLRRCP
jgi:hypothetical protein